MSMNTSETEIEKRVIELIKKSIQVGDNTSITPGSNFVKDLLVDSLDLVELMMSIEAEFKIEIPDADAEKIGTVKDLVKYISEKLAAA